MAKAKPCRQLAVLPAFALMSDSSRPFQSLHEAQRNARVVSVDDVVWSVYELPASSFDRRMSASLIFESEQTIRRVRNFPSAWRELSDEELLNLSWSV